MSFQGARPSSTTQAFITSPRGRRSSSTPWRTLGVERAPSSTCFVASGPRWSRRAPIGWGDRGVLGVRPCPPSASSPELETPRTASPSRTRVNLSTARGAFSSLVGANRRHRRAIQPITKLSPEERGDYALDLGDTRILPSNDGPSVEIGEVTQAVTDLETNPALGCAKPVSGETHGGWRGAALGLDGIDVVVGGEYDTGLGVMMARGARFIALCPYPAWGVGVLLSGYHLPAKRAFYRGHPP